MSYAETLRVMIDKIENQKPFLSTPQIKYLEFLLKLLEQELKNKKGKNG